ncbi:MAG TPA: tetratricopeptide repeat protein [Pseudonocardiaceae bacterium]|nr:tetratricopeptide repeat protein [Pseudonocardiaceae bacterium]
MTDQATRDLLAAGNEALLEAAFRTGDYTEAQTLLRQAFEQAGDGSAAEADVLDRLGWLSHFQALDRGIDATHVDDELASFQRALTIRREIGDPGGVAGALFGIAVAHHVLRGDWDTAMPFLWEALELADPHADDLTRSEVHRHVGFYYLVRDVRPERAIEHLTISQDLRERHGDPRWIPSGIVALGEAHLEFGHRDEAVRLLRDAVRLAKEANLHPRRIGWAADALRRAESPDA